MALQNSVFFTPFCTKTLAQAAISGITRTRFIMTNSGTSGISGLLTRLEAERDRLSLRRERIRRLEQVLQIPRANPNDHDPQPFCPGSDRPSSTPSSRLPDCDTPQNHAPFINRLPSGSEKRLGDAPTGGLPLAEPERQSAAHSLARSSSSRPNRASSPGTIQAKACSAWATQSLSDTTAIRLNAE